MAVVLLTDFNPEFERLRLGGFGLPAIDSAAFLRQSQTYRDDQNYGSCDARTKPLGLATAQPSSRCNMRRPEQGLPTQHVIRVPRIGLR